MTDIPGPGKFEGNPSLHLAEYLYIYSMEQGVDDDYGELETTGWYGIITKMDKPNDEAFLYDEFNVEPECFWHYILHEDSNGFFDYRGFNDLDEARIAWEEISGRSPITAFR